MQEGDDVSQATGLLADVQVLELAQRISGPYCGKILAHLGARVVKIEPPEGDVARDEESQRRDCQHEPTTPEERSHAPAPPVDSPENQTHESLKQEYIRPDRQEAPEMETAVPDWFST